MWITTKAVYDYDFNLIEWEGYWYDGPLALADRAAQAAAGQAQKVAGGMAGELETEGQAIQANVVPQLTREMTAQHVFTPDQLNEILTAAGAGAGGATGAFTGTAELEAARTGAGGASSALLDALSRQKQQTMAKTSEGVAAEDVKGALAQREMATKELAGVGEADVSGALKAMGVQSEDIKDEIEAGQTGWFQNMTSLIQSLKPGAGGGGGAGLSWSIG